MGNLVSLVVAAEVQEGALRLLSTAEHEPLRGTFLGWFRQLVARTGVDLEFLEDRANMEQVEQSGVLHTTLEERFQAIHDAFRAESDKRGLDQGLERERRLLVRLAKRKHGTDVAGPVATLLAGIDNPDRLQDVGEWIVDCEIGGALLARLQGTE